MTPSWQVLQGGAIVLTRPLIQRQFPGHAANGAFAGRAKKVQQR
jgi:hypothetical protein